MLSQTAEYALRSVLAVAALGEDHPVGAARLAEALGIPHNYLSKTLHRLVGAGVLESTRGKSGGFRLARPAGQISLLEVISPFDDVSSRTTCLMGQPVCSDDHPCPAHHRWREVAARTAEFFRETTVADLAEKPPSP